jgi:hypothetical protein
MGPDHQIDLVFHFERDYTDGSSPMSNLYYQNNPFPFFNQPATGDVVEGQAYDFAGDGQGWIDNITNHYVEAP